MTLTKQKDPLAGIIRGRNREALMAAFVAYRNRELYGEDDLFKLVLKFAYTKLYHLEHDFREFGSAETADDWAQEAAVRVWKGIKDFEGSPEMFYSWLHKICFNQATDAFNKLKGEQSEKVQLLIDKEDDYDGDTYAEDNPAIYRSMFRDNPFQIPQSVRGIDRRICELLLDGNSQEETATLLHMKSSAVEMRIHRMKNRQQKERNAESQTASS